MIKLLKKFCILNKFASLKDITNKICEVEEDDEKCTCYVNGDDLIYKFRNEKIYTFYLYGFDKYNNVDEMGSKDKPVYYVFSDIVFEKEVSVVTFFDAKVVFRNCTFGKRVKLLGVNDVVFENNKYFYYHGIENFLYGYGKNLKFVNDNIVNNRSNFYFNELGINVNFDKIEIVNSNIDIDDVVRFSKKDKDIINVVNSGEIFIKSKEFIIINSSIDVAEFYLDSKNITIDETSEIISDSGMILENENNNLELNITTPYLIYNGVELTEEKFIVTNKEEGQLKNSRRDLISTLKSIETKTISINEMTLNKVNEGLKSQPLKKILKRK